MEQVNSQFIHDDSYRFSGPQDGQLAEMVIHFALKPGATLSWRVGTDATLCVQDAGIWLTRIWFPYDHQLPPGRELRLRRGERVWACTDGDAAARLSLTSRLPVRPNVSRWLARLSCVLHRAARQGREDHR